MKRVIREATTQEGDRRPPIKDKEKNKVEEVPQNKQKISTTREGEFMASSLPRSEVLAGEKLMAAFIVEAKETQKKLIAVEFSRQESSKWVRTSSGSSPEICCLTMEQ